MSNVPILFTTELAIELIRAAIKFGPDAAIALASMFKSGATVDDAIAALEIAKTKTAEQFLAEARARAEATNPPQFAPLDLPTPAP